VSAFAAPPAAIATSQELDKVVGRRPRRPGLASTPRLMSARRIDMGWFFVIVMGIIIGLLGKFFAPGNRDNIPIWLTILCGIVGVVIGYGWLGGTRGIDWLAFFVSIIFAAILVMIAATLTGRRSSKTG
jgi:uncharacterized membrane protein YeaQ/YmgE (transglycosylase-associated protein family)